MQSLVAGIEIDARGCMHALSAHGFEKIHRLGDRVDDLLICLAQRRVPQEAQVPVFRMMQIGKAAVDQRPHEIQGQRGAFVAAQQQLGVRLAFRRAESGPIDIVAAVYRQRQSVASFGIGRARLGVLPGETADPHDGLFQALQQHQAHLQQDLEAAARYCPTRNPRSFRRNRRPAAGTARRAAPAPAWRATPRSPTRRPGAAAGSRRQRRAPARLRRHISAAARRPGCARSSGCQLVKAEVMDMATMLALYAIPSQNAAPHLRPLRNRESNYEAQQAARILGT